MPTYYKRNTNPTNNNWNQANNWSTVSSTSATNTGTFPSSSTLDPVIFDASSVGVTVNVLSNCTSITTTGFNGTITLNADLTIATNHVIGATTAFAGSSFYCANGTGSITSNSVSFPNFKLNRSSANFTLTLNDILNVVNITQDSNSATTNGFSVTVTGSMGFASNSVLSYSGTTVYNLTGTGNLGIAGTSPFYACTVNINTSGTITFLTNLNFTGGTLTYTAGTVVTTGNTFQLNGTNTVTSKNVGTGNEISFNNVTAGTAGASLTTTLGSDMRVLGNFTVSNFNGYSFNGNTIYVAGNITNTTTVVNAGTSVMEMYGSSNATISAGILSRSLTINKSSGATVTLLGSLTFGATGGSLTMNTAINYTTNSTTVTLVGTTLTINNPIGSSFFNLTVPTNQVLTLSGASTPISSTLLCSGNATFAGAYGWAATNFTHAGAAFTCTLQAGNTYTVNGVLTMIGTAASRAVLQSSDAVAVTASIASSSNQLVVTAGTLTAPAAGYVLGSTSTALPIALNNLLPDRPTIASGAASPYTLVSSIGATALASGSYTLGKKAILIVTNGTGSTSIAYVTIRDIDSNGGITVLAFGSYSDAIGQPSANIFRTLNWGPLVAPSGSVYYTFVN